MNTQIDISPEKINKVSVDKQSEYQNEIVPKFRNIITQLHILRKVMFEKHRKFIQSYIEDNKIRRGLVWPSDAGKFKDKEGNRLDTYYDHCGYTYNFWNNLRIYCEKKIDSGNNNEEIVEVKGVLDTILKNANVVKDRNDILMRYNNYAIIVGKNMEVSTLSEDRVYEITMDMLDRSISAFNPDKEDSVMFKNYLTINIKRAIKNEDGGYGRSEVDKLLREIHKYLRRYQALNDGQLPSDSEIAREIKIDLEKVKKLKKIWHSRRHTISGLTLDKASRIVGDSSASDKFSTIENRLLHRQYKEIMQKVLKEIRNELNDKERYILDNRLLLENPLTLQNIADKFNLSRERIRQIDLTLRKKIKKKTQEMYNVTNFNEL